MIITFPKVGYVSSLEGIQLIPWDKLSQPELIGLKHWGGGSATLTLWLTRPQQAVDFSLGIFCMGGGLLKYVSPRNLGEIMIQFDE